MNLSNLRQSHPLLLAHMKEIGYSERYIHSVQIEINRILLHEKDNSWNSYQDIYQDYASSPHSERSLLGKATLIGIIAHFDLEGIYPGKHQWHTLWERCVYTQLVPEFKGLVDYYRNLTDTLQICENTVKKNISAISNFLHFLQKAGCNSLSSICEQHVLDFFSDDGYGPSKTASHKNCISRILRACSGYSEYCLTADSFLPPIHNRRKNVQYITQGEISVLREFADKDMFPLRALKMLTAYYSRGCDSKELFKGKILENADSFADHLNKYDVIYLNIQQFLIGSKKQDMTEYLEQEVLEELLEEYGKYLARQDKGLVDTLKGIYAKTGKKFIFLIDEWDCVIRERQNDEKLQKQYLDFLRGLLKDQPFVALVYMTGILPVKKYGEHSALNMFWEYSMADPEVFEEYTGFTEYEVQKLCEQFDMDFSETSRWYDGYRFRRFHHVYNPRSVVATMKCHKFSNYWTSTETYEALKVYIDMNFDGLRSDVVKMLGGEPVQVNTLQGNCGRVRKCNECQRLDGGYARSEFFRKAA